MLGSSLPVLSLFRRDNKELARFNKLDGEGRGLLEAVLRGIPFRGSLSGSIRRVILLVLDWGDLEGLGLCIWVSSMVMLFKGDFWEPPNKGLLDDLFGPDQFFLSCMVMRVSPVKGLLLSILWVVPFLPAFLSTMARIMSPPIVGLLLMAGLGRSLSRGNANSVMLLARV